MTGRSAERIILHCQGCGRVKEVRPGILKTAARPGETDFEWLYRIISAARDERESAIMPYPCGHMLCAVCSGSGCILCARRWR